MSEQFVADVGGTNIRLATVRESALVDVLKMQCNDFASIDLAINAYFAQFPHRKYSAGCIAIACPVMGDEVKMTNHSWSFSQIALKQTLGLSNLFVMNDFMAVAHSLPHLQPSQLLQIGNGTPVERGNVVVFGPGTGLGVEHMMYTSSGWQTLDGEGGHVDFAPTDETDVAIWRFLQKKLGRASAEEVMSGRGIVNIYLAICEQQGHTPKFTEAAQITHAAIEETCAVSAQVLQQFCRIMGSFAGNLALNTATRGGVFIGGGIVSRFTDFILHSDFRERFEAKGVLAEYVSDIPTYLITEPDHGLLGAKAFLQQQLKSNG